MYNHFFRLYFVLSPMYHLVESTHLPIQSSDLSSFCVHKLVSPEYAAELAGRVRSSEQLQRVNSVLSVLGHASYIMGPKGKYAHPYKNDYLRAHFGDIHNIVLEYFRSRVEPGYRVKYRFALPGFHMFHCNALFSLPVASVHTDRQYRFLPKAKHDTFDTQKTLSFTLVLELPESGGGLYVLDGLLPTRVKYSPGHIVCHNGQSVHMIASSGQSHSRDRITLQGHGVLDRRKKIWWLYW